MREQDLNEFQQAQQLSDREILSKIEPEWSKAKLDPFLTSVQQDVELPVWNKIEFDPTNFGISGGDSGGGSTITGIMVQNGVAIYVYFPGTPGGPV